MDRIEVTEQLTHEVTNVLCRLAEQPANKHIDRCVVELAHVLATLRGPECAPGARLIELEARTALTHAEWADLLAAWGAYLGARAALTGPEQALAQAFRKASAAANEHAREKK